MITIFDSSNSNKKNEVKTIIDSVTVYFGENYYEKKYPNGSSFEKISFDVENLMIIEKPFNTKI